jgi:4-amino-4-deoxy-L-arabinose transferase-like glycosyltransferase
MIAYFLLIALLASAGALRFYQLGEWSFWIDEVNTVLSIQKVFMGGLNFYDMLERQRSLLLIGSMVTLFAPSVWNARFVPALIGTISILLFYFPIRKMFNPSVALMTGLLLALSPWHIYWSQNARYVSTLLLFSTLALFSFYFALEEDRAWYILATQLFLFLAIRERLFALLIVPILLVYVVLLKKLSFEKPIGLHRRNLALFFLPALIPVLFFSWNFIRAPSLWLELFFGKTNSNPLLLLLQITSFVRFSVIFVGSLAAFYLLPKKNRAVLLLALAVVIPLLIVTGAALVQFSTPRYAIISLVPWLILASLGMTQLLTHHNRRVKLLGSIILLMLLFDLLGQNLLYYNHQHQTYRPDWKGAFTLVSQQREESEMIVTSAWRSPLAFYYLGEEVAEMDDISPTDIEQSKQRVWFVLLKVRIEAEWKSWLAQHCDVLHESREIEVCLYDPEE